MATPVNSKFPMPQKYKIVFVGNEAVGKTSMITRYVNGHFDASYEATIGVDFLTKQVFRNSEEKIKLQLWDTAGQERFRSLIPSYIRNTHVACLIFDITDRNSFECIKFWLEQLKQHHKKPKQLKLFLIGNKTDLEDSRAVDSDEGFALANKLGMHDYFEVSAKSGDHIDDMFDQIVAKLPQVSVITPS